MDKSAPDAQPQVVSHLKCLGGAFLVANEREITKFLDIFGLQILRKVAAILDSLITHAHQCKQEVE